MRIYVTRPVLGFRQYCYVSMIESCGQNRGEQSLRAKKLPFSLYDKMIDRNASIDDKRVKDKEADKGKYIHTRYDVEEPRDFYCSNSQCRVLVNELVYLRQAVRDERAHVIV